MGGRDASSPPTAALSWLSAAHSDVPAIAGLLYGIQPVVIAILLDALLRVGKRTLRHAFLIGLAAAAFVAIYFFGIRFPVVVLCAAALGWLVASVDDANGAGQADEVAAPGG